MKTIMTQIPTSTLSSSLRISMKDRVSKNEVSDFKNKWCDENQIIADIISNDLSDFFVPPVLDVGAGLGDIAYNALPHKKVICIDVNNVTEEDYPLADKHERLQIDFFDYRPTQKINTVFISHTLQFLDEDVEKLNDKLKKIDPQNVILVVNKNDDFMGKLVDWSKNHYENPNPEVSVAGFPEGYGLDHTKEFKATLFCDSFERLAEQISYLMLIDFVGPTKSKLIAFLKSHLPKPEFTFNQEFKIYQKDEER